MQDFIRIQEKDNVVVALRDIHPGERFCVPAGQNAIDSESQQGNGTGAGGRNEITALEEIPAGHKMAVCDIPEGGEVIKYGYRIGNAKEPIRAGAWIHTHNIRTALGNLLEYTYEPVFAGEQEAEPGEGGELVFGANGVGNCPGGSGNAAGGAGATRLTGGVKNRNHSDGDKEAAQAQGAENRSAIEETDGGSCKEKERSRFAEMATEPSFMGFRRPDGKVGVRNEIWIIPTVGCVNNVATEIARRANSWLVSQGRCQGESQTGAQSGGKDNGRQDNGREALRKDSQSALESGSALREGCFGGGVDEVIAFPHPYGCSQMGEDQEHTRKILADLVNHPNAGGVLVLGLGCENSNIDVLKPYIGDYDEDRVKFLVAQECEDEITEALEIVKGLVGYASSFRREPVSVSELIIGMKCGGSDGLSGITANPLVGSFSDRLIVRGGTTILTEVPEMFGAETILMNRCANEELFAQTVALINDFKNYFKSHNQTIYENPSPGNKKGGISTLEDKSLGCTQKSGSAPVRGVLQYGETVHARGLNLLSAPGNDLVAATALAAAGAQIVLFTTGRGTPFASPVPTVKISTNSALAGRKAKWIDFNAGVLVEDGDMESETERLFGYVVEVASGRKVCSEEAGYHDMAIFKQGVTL